MNYIKSIIRCILYIVWFVIFPFYLIYMLWNNSYYYLKNMEPKDVEEKVMRGAGFTLLWLMFLVPMVLFIILGIMAGTETVEIVGMVGGIYCGVIGLFLIIHLSVRISVYGLKHKEIHKIPEWLR